MQTEKLVRFLRSTWNSPIFGDAFPLNVETCQDSVLSQFGPMETLFVTSMDSLLTPALPAAVSNNLRSFYQQIGPKAISFCLTIAVGEIADIERLRVAAVNMLLVYWADQSMDGGDPAMLAAVRLLSDQGNKNPPISPEVAATLMIQSRLGILRWIEQEVKSITWSADEAQMMLQCIFQDTLQNQANLAELRRRYVLEGAKDFWAARSPQDIDHIAQVLIITGGITVYLTSLLYAVYKYQRPDLPSLSEIFSQPLVMNVLSGPCDATLRVFDDLEDQVLDNNYESGEQKPSLNIFNRPNIELVQSFLLQAGFRDERIFQSVLEAFQTNTETSRAYIVQAFRELVCNRLLTLPSSIWGRYSVFLILAKRVVETSVGSMEEAERILSLLINIERRKF